MFATKLLSAILEGTWDDLVETISPIHETKLLACSMGCAEYGITTANFKSLGDRILISAYPQ